MQSYPDAANGVKGKASTPALADDTGFVMVPRSILFAPDLTDAEKVTLFALYSHTRAHKAPKAWPGVDALAAQLHHSPDKVNRSTAGLSRKGYVGVTQERDGGGRFRRNVYHLDLMRGLLEAHSAPAMPDDHAPAPYTRPGARPANPRTGPVDGERSADPTVPHFCGTKNSRTATLSDPPTHIREEQQQTPPTTGTHSRPVADAAVVSFLEKLGATRDEALSIAREAAEKRWTVDQMGAAHSYAASKGPRSVWAYTRNVLRTGYATASTQDVGRQTVPQSQSPYKRFAAPVDEEAERRERARAERVIQAPKSDPPPLPRPSGPWTANTPVEAPRKVIQTDAGPRLEITVPAVKRRQERLEAERAAKAAIGEVRA